MTQELVRYDAACKAIAKACATDEVLKIRDQGAMLRAYAKQAKNRALEVTAVEIRMRAERRVGELIQAQRNGVGLARGTRGTLKGRTRSGGSLLVPPDGKAATLTDAGIDKHLADRARKLAAIPAKQFETAIADWREQQTYKAERVSADLARRASPKVAKSPVTNPGPAFDPVSEAAFDIHARIRDRFYKLTSEEQIEFLVSVRHFLSELERLRAERTNG